MMNPVLKHKEITDMILRSFYDVYNELGHGFLESVYENAMQNYPRKSAKIRGQTIKEGIL